MGIITVTDISIAVILIIAVISGYINGLIVKIAQFASLVASFIIASATAKILLPGLKGKIFSQPYGGFIKEKIVYNIIFTIVFLVAFIILRHVAGMLKFTRHIPVIGFLDRIGGAVAGFLTDFIVIYIIAGIFFSVIPQEILESWGFTQEAIRNSLLLQAFY